MRNLFLLIVLICISFSSCASFAMNMVANALTGEGGADVFTSDNDPQLVGDALPFAIKMYEALLASVPGHQGLMLTTGSLFIMYANAFVQGPAEMLPMEYWRQREEAMQRAKNLYLRGYAILSDALEARFPGFSEASVENGSLQRILNRARKDDAALLYWAVAGGMAAYAIDVFDFTLSARIPRWTVMIQRAYELNPNLNGAALDEFLVIFYASLPEILGGDRERARFHFERAQERTDGTSVGAYVTWARSVFVPAQDYDSFRAYLEKALAVDVDANPSSRLVNIINQRKARWLLDNAYLSFSFLPMPDDF